MTPKGNTLGPDSVSWWDKFFEFFGLGVPFYLATATYGVFVWLDKNASDEVTQIISSWLNGRSQHKPDLGNLIINAFDRIYTSPLLSFRAFRRSAVISLIIWFLLFLLPQLVRHDYIGGIDSLLFAIWSADLFAVAVSDYVSLFLVRKYLNFARLSPIKASVIAAAAGAMIVIIGLQYLLLLSLLSFIG